ncbi:unnamed protein product [Closterium sp. NIES-64]|nr:unnamed protein product [Closterium sp. NIES-64]
MSKELAPGGRPQLVGEYTVETVSPPGYSDEPPKLAVASLERGNARKFGNPGVFAAPLESPLFSAALVDAMTGGAYLHIAFDPTCPTASQYNLSYVVAIVDPEEDPVSPLLRNLQRHPRHAGPAAALRPLALGQPAHGALHVGSDVGGGGAEKKGGGAFAAIGKKLGGKKGGKKGGTAGKNHPQSLSAGASSSSIKTASLSNTAGVAQPNQIDGTPLSSKLKDRAETAALSLQTLGRKGGKKGGKGGKGAKTGGDSSSSGGKKTKGADPAADAGGAGGDTGGADAGGAGGGSGSNGAGAVDEEGRAEMPYMEAMASLLAYSSDGGDGSTSFELSVFGASRMVGSSSSLELTANTF